MPIDRRGFIISGAAAVASAALPARVARAIEEPVFFPRDALVPKWLNRSERPAWFGVDVFVSPRGPEERTTVVVAETVDDEMWVEFLASLTTREIAVQQKGPLARYTVAPVRPLEHGERMAYGKGAAVHISPDELTSNAIWTGTPELSWRGFRGYGDDWVFQKSFGIDYSQRRYLCAIS